MVDKGASSLGLGMTKIALVFKNSHGCQHRVIGQAEFAQGFGDFPATVAEPFFQIAFISRNSASVRSFDFALAMLEAA